MKDEPKPTATVPTGPTVILNPNLVEALRILREVDILPGALNLDPDETRYYLGAKDGLHDAMIGLDPNYTAEEMVGPLLSAIRDIRAARRDRVGDPEMGHSLAMLNQAVALLREGEVTSLPRLTTPAALPAAPSRAGQPAASPTAASSEGVITLTSLEDLDGTSVQAIVDRLLLTDDRGGFLAGERLSAARFAVNTLVSRNQPAGGLIVTNFCGRARLVLKPVGIGVRSWVEFQISAKAPEDGWALLSLVGATTSSDVEFRRDGGDPQPASVLANQLLSEGRRPFRFIPKD